MYLSAPLFLKLFVHYCEITFNFICTKFRGLTILDMIVDT